jgi:hypothetical protein
MSGIASCGIPTPVSFTSILSFIRSLGKLCCFVVATVRRIVRQKLSNDVIGKQASSTLIVHVLVLSIIHTQCHDNAIITLQTIWQAMLFIFQPQLETQQRMHANWLNRVHDVYLIEWWRLCSISISTTTSTTA